MTADKTLHVILDTRPGQNHTIVVNTHPTTDYKIRVAGGEYVVKAGTTKTV